MKACMRACAQLLAKARTSGVKRERARVLASLRDGGDCPCAVTCHADGCARKPMRASLLLICVGMRKDLRVEARVEVECARAVFPRMCVC
eukprot:1057727-Pleurochrysis_carterae.AAC.5